MIPYVKKEFARLFETIGKTDPCSDEYRQLLGNIELFNSIAVTIEDVYDVVYAFDEEPPKEKPEFTVVKLDPEYAIPDETPFDEPTIFNKEEVTPEATEEPATAVTEETKAAPEPEVSTADEQKYTSSQVRSALADARRNGTDVAALIKSYGVSNFSALPADKYGEVMRKLGAE